VNLGQVQSRLAGKIRSIPNFPASPGGHSRSPKKKLGPLPEKFVKVRHIKSLKDYMVYLEERDPNAISLFRGQSDKSWPLFPKLARLHLQSRLRKPSGGDFLAVEQKIMNEFKHRSMPYLSARPTNNWDWLSTAQHYKLPTRLLDWTSDALIALWFAVEDQTHGKTHGIVWRFIPGDDDFLDDSTDPFHGNLTRVYQPYFTNERIVNQNSWFTFHRINDGEKFIPLERNKNYADKLDSVIISCKHKPLIRKQLDRCGVNHAVVYPGLEGVAQFIEWDYTIDKDEESTRPNP